MKITPFGKQKGQQDGLSVYADLLGGDMVDVGDEAADAGESIETPMEAQAPQDSLIDDVQTAIEGVVGEPSLDNLFVILSAIGMSQVNIKVAEDGSSLSVSGIIDFSDPEAKIIKKD